jgi:hypothetical protein
MAQAKQAFSVRHLGLQNSFVVVEEAVHVANPSLAISMPASRVHLACFLQELTVQAAMFCRSSQV